MYYFQYSVINRRSNDRKELWDILGTITLIFPSNFTVTNSEIEILAYIRTPYVHSNILPHNHDF